MRDISVKGQQSINSLLRQRMMDAIFCFLLLLLHLFRVLEALVSHLSTAGGCLRLTGSCSTSRVLADATCISSTFYLVHYIII